MPSQDKVTDPLVISNGRLKEELEQFTYIASHDLQEPLREVMAYCDLLKTHYHELLDNVGKSYIEAAINSAHFIQQRVAAMLHYSRITNNSYEFEEVDLENIIASSLHAFEDKITSANINVTSTSMPVIWGDKILIGQLFGYLIDNAIKFRNADAPTLSIDSYEEEGRVIIRVADNGIGMEQEYDEIIFVLFQQLHSQDRYPGIGAGLALAKKICDIHNQDQPHASIWMESQEQSGSTFYVAFPKYGTNTNHDNGVKDE